MVSYPMGEGLAISLDDNEVVASELGDAGRGLGRPDQSHCLFYRTDPTGDPRGARVQRELGAGWRSRRQGRASNYGVAIDAVVCDAKARLADKSVPDDLADAIRRTARAGYAAEAESNPEYFSVFISYSHADSVFANRLYNAIQARGVGLGWT